MRVHLGSDHAGFEVKKAVAEALRGDGHEVVDHGAFPYDDTDDYPVYCLRLRRLSPATRPAWVSCSVARQR